MRKSGINKTCPACGASFYVQKYRADAAKFCSMKCLWDGRKPRPKKLVTAKCVECGGDFSIPPHRLAKARYCSKKCMGVELRRVTSDARQAWNLTRPKMNPDQKKSAQKEYRSRDYRKHKEERAKKSAKYYLDTKPVRRAANKVWREKNLERAREISRNRRRDKPEEVRAARRQHYRDNQPIYVAQARAREKRIKQATPPWADMKAIEQFYVRAAEVSKLTGIKHHVDHFCPLRSPIMCGLHVEANLRVVPAVVNLAKSNRIIDDAANPRCCAWPNI